MSDDPEPDDTVADPPFELADADPLFELADAVDPDTVDVACAVPLRSLYPEPFRLEPPDFWPLLAPPSDF